jgi:hypothetical protein
MNKRITERLFWSIRRACLLNYISYAKWRLEINETSNLLPEVKSVLKHFSRKSLATWYEEMRLHNALFKRGKRMGLGATRLPSLEFESLDRFMLQMHADKIAEVLESFTAFAKRLVPIMELDPDAPSWWLNRNVLIHREHWHRYAQQVFSLLKLIGFHDDDTNGHRASLSDMAEHRVWPDAELLVDACQRAMQMLGELASPDFHLPAHIQIQARLCRRKRLFCTFSA